VEPQVPRVHDASASPPKTQGVAPVCETGQGAYQGDRAEGPWTLAAEGDRGDNPVPSGVGGVLPAIPGEERLRGAGSVDTAEVALHPVASVEEAANQGREDDPTRDREGESHILVQQRTWGLVECRSVAYERCDYRQVARPGGTYESSDRSSRLACLA